MEKIKLRVSGNAIEVTERPAIITSGTIGLPVEFTFDSRWDTLTKLTVFRAGDVAITAAEPGVVPWEVLEKPNVWLQIGVYGVNADGTVAIPTLWANVCVIHTGVNPDGEVSIDPTTTVWQRVLERIDKLQVDTAPAGFGLGEKSGRIVVDANTAVRSGFYAMAGETAVNTPSEYPNFRYGHLLVEARYGKEIRQTISYNNIFAVRLSLDGGVTWGEWEYVNPPMEVDVWYRTTERFDGKVVYKCLYPDYQFDPEDSDSTIAWVYCRIGDDPNEYPYLDTIGAASKDFVWFIESRIIDELDSHRYSNNNPHQVTAKQIGAAPAGYGLGETRGRYCDDCNTATEIGFYRLSGESCKNVPLVAPYLNYGVMFVERRVEFIQQTVTRTNVVIKRYSVDNGSTWSEWEWVNPPMYPGVEYRTTERFNGEPVYAQLFELGETPEDGGEKFVHFDSEGVISHVVRMEGECDGGGYIVSLESAIGVLVAEIGVEPGYGTFSLVAHFEEGVGGWTLNVIVYYTKTQGEVA